MREKNEWLERNPNRGFIEQGKEFMKGGINGAQQENKEEKDPPPEMVKYCQIRFKTLMKIFPKESQQYLDRKTALMLRRQKSITLCRVCKKDKTDMISWTPCAHVECVECALSRFEKLLMNGQNDRDSLVCYNQDIVCFKDIRNVLKSRLDLLSKLGDQSQYNYYQRQDICPNCESNLWVDRNHSEQRCFSCNYEFCNQCLLAAHEGVTCKEKRRTYKADFQNQKTVVKKEGEYFRTCTKCGAYARRFKGPELDIVSCEWCPLIMCLKHNSVPKLKEKEGLCCEGLKLIYF